MPCWILLLQRVSLLWSLMTWRALPTTKGFAPTELNVLPDFAITKGSNPRELNDLADVVATKRFRSYGANCLAGCCCYKRCRSYGARYNPVKRWGLGFLF